MTNETIRDHCLGLPHVTEIVQWEDHLLFKIGGKMFAIIALDGHSCSLRCTPEKYAELVEMADVVPCSHNMWKYQWVTTETLTAVPDREFRSLLTESYQIVRAGLPKTLRAELDGDVVAGRSMSSGHVTKPHTIDQYLAPLSTEKRAALEKLRRAIKAAAPKAEECISYGIPAFRLNGRMLVFFGAAAKHCAFYPGAFPIETHKDALEAYDTSKGTIRFPPDRPLPATLVRTLVKARIAQRADAHPMQPASRRR